jgi:glycosyltransferase involved in cell wall biosynthesis
MSQGKVALVHEWVEKFGGSEAVLDEFVKMFPESDLFVLWSNFPERYPIPTHESVLASTFLRNHKALSLPLQLAAWRSFKGKSVGYDRILVSSHLFAHHFKLPNPSTAKKYVYAHTPARYIWEPERDRRGDNPLFKLAASLIKPVDRKRAGEAHKIAANSAFTQEKIALAWERESTVIHPPVRVSEIQRKLAGGISLSDTQNAIVDSLPEAYILGASRFIEYKNLDRVIDIGEWTDTPVVLAGSGPLLERLKLRANSASVPVTIIESPDDDLLLSLFSNAIAYVFPPVEDFGVMPLEAGACGTAVISNFIGGAAETINQGMNGWQVDMQSKSSILEGFNKIDRINSINCISEAMKFDSSVFRANIQRWTEE